VAQWPWIRRPGWRSAWTLSAIVAMGLVSFDTHYGTLAIASPQGITHRTFWTWHQTWAGALKQAGVRIGRHDRLSRRLSSAVTGPLTIWRGIRVTVVTEHHRYREWTTRYRVGAILAALDVRLGSMDLVDPGRHQTIAAGTVIRVIRRRFSIRTSTSTVAYSTEYRPDPSMYVGQRREIQQGQNGTRTEVQQTLLANGHPVAESVVTDRITQPAQVAVIEYGTENSIDRGGSVVYFSREITMLATAYWPDPAWSSGVTALGLPARYGVVAVDPSVIPLGTRLYIPGYGFAIAADTGSAIVGNRIDLCFNTGWQAQAFGVQMVQVFVVAPAP
jgi:3D (Asp-Asp-Asp) domain-containing protein